MLKRLLYRPALFINRLLKGTLQLIVSVADAFYNTLAFGSIVFLCDDERALFDPMIPLNCSSVSNIVVYMCSQVWCA